MRWDERSNTLRSSRSALKIWLAAMALAVLTAWCVAGEPVLVGQWPLATDARDSSGNGHHGTVKGGLTFSPEESAAVFDGVGAYVNFGDVAIPSSFSISLWLRPDWPNDGNVMRVMGKFRLSDLKVLALFADEKGRLWIYISEDGAEDGKRSILKATAEPALAESGEWRFVVVRWDATKAANGLAVLVDGVVVPVVAATEANITQLSSRKVDLTLGAYDVQTVTENGVTSDVVRNPFRGMISGLSIWDGVLSDGAVAATFAAGRVVESPEVPKAPKTTVVAPAQPEQPPQPIQSIKTLADNAQAVENELDYGTVFTRKQQLLAAFSATALTDADIAESARLAKLLAEDLYSEQRVELARKLRLRWLADKVMMAGRSEAELTVLLDAIWFVCPEQAREALTDWFSDETLRNAVSGKGLAFAGMLAGKPWSDVEMPGSIIDPATLPAVDARLLTLEAGLDRDALANAALAFGYAGDLQRSRKWAMKVYDAVLGNAENRAGLGLADLKFVTGVLGQEWLKSTQTEYPEFLEVLLRLAAAGELPSDKTTLGSLARLCSGPNARQAITSEVEAHPDAAHLPLARVLTAAITTGQDLDAWCKRMDEHISSVQGDALAFWTMVRGDAEVIRIYPVVPGRRLSWIRKAERLVVTEDMRLGWAREFGDYYSDCALPGMAADELSGKSDLLTGERSSDAITLIHSLDVSRDEVARKQARFQRLIRHERLKRQQDYLERMRVLALQRSDTARVRTLDAQLVSVREEVSR